jgi:hypothetical protein
MQVLSYAFLLMVLWNIVFPAQFRLNSQPFEGEIVFIKTSMNDTSYVRYNVKGDKVRMEELDKEMKTENYLITDLTNRIVYTINPRRKIFAELPVYPWNGKPDTLNYIVLKTGNYKTIKGIKCIQWRVQNKKENTEIQFWTAPEQYRFFAEFHALLNQAEKITQYYLNTPGIYGQLPFESSERSLVREMRMHMEVLSIVKKSLNTSLFAIPEGYRLFQKN